MNKTLETLVQAWRDQRDTAADLVEFSRLGDRERNEIAEDSGLSVGQLTAVIANGRRSGRLMRGVMREVGLDPEAIGAEDPALMRELAVTCALCDAQGKCRHDLAAGRSAEAHGAYCPNAGTFRRLAEEG